MKVFVSMIVALGLTAAFAVSAFAGSTQAKADCERGGQRWDSKTQTCYSANGY
jgi:hypothetical protein